MMKWTIKRALSLGIFATLIIAAVMACYFAGRASYAYTPGTGRGGNSNSADVGGCKSSGTNCTSWGVGWFTQSYDEFAASANRVGLTDQQKNDMKVATAGMVDPQVIRFAYADYANGGNTQLGTMSGLIRNEVADRNNTVYIDPSSIAGGISPETAKFLYEYAVAIGVPMQYDWDGTAVFAFDQAWLTYGADPAILAEVKAKMQEQKQQQGIGGTATAYFQAKTIIDVGDGVPSGDSVQDSGWDGHVEIEFSTDKSDVSVTFTHTIEYQPGNFTMGAKDQFTTEGTAGDISAGSGIPDVADTVNNRTPYSVTTGGGGDLKRFDTSSGGPESVTNTVSVHLEPNGEPQTVCSYITYDNKYANMASKKHIEVHYVAATATTPEVPEDSHYDWYNSGYSGPGSSGACATITRPSEPGGQPYNPSDATGSASGSSTANLMFAGETANIAWDIWADTWNVRRLMKRQVVAYLVNATPGTHNAPIWGNSRAKSSPEGYYSGGYIVNTKNFGEEARDINNSYDDYLNSFGIVVPDYTGYKYCNSGGYYYEWWYSINGNWKHDSRGRDYWYVYGASCRTIAKKPSVSFWNGSMLTVSDVATSASPRFNSADMGKRATEGGATTLYGSWAEYLGVINGDVKYFTSGASVARGSSVLVAPKSNPLDTSNSPLTVANGNQLGKSGIYNNSVYRTRLSTFLENRATLLESDSLGTMSNVSDTIILRRDGNLKITGDITVNAGAHENIYRVPQVVIFVHGNLEITSDVSRIDAWLIVDGDINTCSDFTPGVTEADALTRVSNTCSKQLVFNGPVLANRVALNRSFGSDPIVTRLGTFGNPPAKYNAAEVFNMRTDNYLWARAQAGRYNSSYTESYSRELPPRY